MKWPWLSKPASLRKDPITDGIEEIALNVLLVGAGIGVVITVVIGGIIYGIVRLLTHG